MVLVATGMRPYESAWLLPANAQQSYTMKTEMIPTDDGDAMIEVLMLIPNNPPGGVLQQKWIYLVHGASHSSECWLPVWATRLTQLGFVLVLISLRGHGRSTTKHGVGRASLDDYVQDVETGMYGAIMPNGDQLSPNDMVMVGHSMGGFIVQRYAYTHFVHRIVALCTSTPNRAMACLISAGNTLHIPKQPHLFVNSANLFREYITLLVGAGASETEKTEVSAQLGDESWMIYKNMIGDALRGVKQMQTEGIFWISAARDIAFSQENTLWAALKYNERWGIPLRNAKIDGAHDIMLYDGSIEAANRVAQFALDDVV
jgi:pimeloyl-ACP methyl ester carboxylesterase